MLEAFWICLSFFFSLRDPGSNFPFFKKKNILDFCSWLYQFVLENLSGGRNSFVLIWWNPFNCCDFLFKNLFISEYVLVCIYVFLLFLSSTISCFLNFISIFLTFSQWIQMVSMWSIMRDGLVNIELKFELAAF